MKRTAATLIGLILISISLQAQTGSDSSQTTGTQVQEQTSPGSKMEKTSYTLGYFFGTDLKKEQIEMDTAVFLMGFKDALSGRASLIPDSIMKKIFTEFSEEMNVKKMMIAKTVSDKNKKEADSVLAENKKKDSVITTASGLEYKILREGTGASPAIDDTVVAHYRGWFLNGKEFDNSYSRGEPATFLMKGIIKGWTEALQLMKVGSKHQLWIPPSLGYGERGYGNVIEPSSLLLFEVELLDVRKGTAPAPEPAVKATPKKGTVKKETKKK
jgi:FKBP-type peptidyl-prolyl cis-trans isomerase